MHVVIVGAGAAGLMAAATAATTCRADAEPGEVTVLEKNRKAGVKILMSGGTRCNLTHDCGPAGIMEAFGQGGSFLRQALALMPPADVVGLFHSLGVATQVESTGKVFPSSNRALDVRDALLRYATEAGAQVRLATSVQSIEPDGPRFSVHTDQGTLIADRVIVTSGGRSYPGCGTIGEGYVWMKTLGHSIVPTRPALVPLVGGEPWMHEISGVTLDRVSASVWARAEAGKKAPKRPLLTRTGGFLFTHLGYSGPTAMDVSGTITGAGDPAMTRLTLDLIPDTSPAAIEQWFQDCRAKDGKRKVVSALGEWLPKRLAEAICSKAGASVCTFAEMPRAAMAKLGEDLKRLPLPVTGTRGFEKAEVTAGGVSLREVDPRTMQSRLVPGLFIAGEILDLDGWIGGYNFQSAFSTGYTAGLHAARR
ncbi:MAG: NAD(P)/FAD-dependent oxidoreductase [Planctomycetaceae bacterium]